MKTGDIVLVPYPFAELTNVKVRPALVITTTKDKYQDILVSAITSVVRGKTGDFEILLQPNKTNNLRAISIIKVDRIVTLKKEDVITTLGKLSLTQLKVFKAKFRKLVD
jgi:mRNA interferase MazF